MAKKKTQTEEIKNNQPQEESVDQTPDDAQTPAEKSEIELIKEDLDQTKDMLLRTAAEFDNYKKRTEKEKNELSAFVKAACLKALLPVADNIARAALYEKGSEDYVKGLDMITKQLCESLKQLGLEEIDCTNQPFDPNFHEAVMHIDDENYADGTIVEVLQAGYKCGDVVIRPAMVKVAN